MTAERKDLAATRLDAQVREAEARLDALQAQAEARKASEDMAEISGLRAASERARKALGDLRREAAGNAEAFRLEAEREVRDLNAGIDRLDERYAAWDDARERRFNARLDEAEARLRAWKARDKQRHAEHLMKRHDELAALEERIALARARSAEAAHDRYDLKSQEALEDAARHFDEAFEAASKRYETRGER